MKKNLLLLAVLSITFIATSISATETKQKDIQKLSENTRISLVTKDAVEIGLQTYWYKYEEEVNGNFFMSTQGQKYGLSLTGIKNIGNDVYIIGDIHYATGDVEYNNNSGGRGDNITDRMYEGRFLVGRDFLSDGILWSPFIGLGYRHLFNDARDLGPGGYRRESHYLYVPIGITHRFRANYTSRISTTLEYDYFVQGKQESYLSDVNPVYGIFGDPLVNDQNSGYGIKLNTSYEEGSWSVGVFFNYWKIADSETNYYIIPPYLISFQEPENDTKEIGLQVKYRF